MNNNATILAQRYAQAFVNVFGVDRALLGALQKTVAVLEQNATFLFLLNVACVPFEERQRVLKKLFEQCGLGSTFDKLIDLLLRQKRGLLIRLVVEQVVRLYFKALKIVPCTITTAHEIDEAMREVFAEFLARNLGCDIMYTHRIDPALIAGVRLQTDTVVWEYSVRKQLQEMRALLVR